MSRRRARAAGYRTFELAGLGMATTLATTMGTAAGLTTCTTADEIVLAMKRVKEVRGRASGNSG